MFVESYITGEPVYFPLNGATYIRKCVCGLSMPRPCVTKQVGNIKKYQIIVGVYDSSMFPLFTE